MSAFRDTDGKWDSHCLPNIDTRKMQCYYILTDNVTDYLRLFCITPYSISWIYLKDIFLFQILSTFIPVKQ